MVHKMAFWNATGLAHQVLMGRSPIPGDRVQQNHHTELTQVISLFDSI